MTATPSSPSLPAGLFLRLSGHSLDIARYDAETHSDFAYSSYRLSPNISLAANLREARRTEQLLQSATLGNVQVMVSAPATFVPLADFQEEDCEAIYDLCFPQEGKRRVFYDVVAATNCVVIFALKESVCRTLEEAFGNVNYLSSFTPLIRHFATKGIGMPGLKRCFVYVHEQTADLVVFEDNRLLVANSYTVGNAVDVAYFTLSVAGQLGAATAPAATEQAGNGKADVTANAESYAPIYVAGDGLWQKSAGEELRKYAVNVCPVNPAGEFNRHVVATTPNVPYDLMTLLLDLPQ